MTTHLRSYFDATNVMNAYWAGFIAADGCITSDRGRPKLSISLQRQDKAHLEVLQGQLEYTGHVRDYQTRDGHQYSQLAIGGAVELAESLESKFRITPRKSLTLQPPKLDNLHHIMAYIVGYIDGDGSIYTPTDRQCDVSISIVGTKQLLEWVASYIDILCCSDYHTTTLPSKPRVGKQGESWQYSFGGRRAVDFYHLVRQLDLPWLNRKWSKLVDFSPSRERYLRPWGVIDVDKIVKDYSVKTLRIAPGHQTSLQRHSQRHEMIILLDGEVEITHHNHTFTKGRASRASSYRFLAGDWHRLSCPRGQTGWATVLEVGYGKLIYDDFERKEDKYDRERKRGPGFKDKLINNIDWRQQ